MAKYFIEVLNLGFLISFLLNKEFDFKEHEEHHPKAKN